MAARKGTRRSTSGQQRNMTSAAYLSGNQKLQEFNTNLNQYLTQCEQGWNKIHRDGQQLSETLTKMHNYNQSVHQTRTQAQSGAGTGTKSSTKRPRAQAGAGRRSGQQAGIAAQA